MLHWYKEEKAFRWQRKGGWFLEVSWWRIQFWTPKIMYCFSWWNPFTHKLLIQMNGSHVPHPKS